MDKTLPKKFELSDLIACEVSRKGFYNEVLAMAIEYLTPPGGATRFESSIGEIVFFEEDFENFQKVTIAHTLEVQKYLKNLS